MCISAYYVINTNRGTCIYFITFRCIPNASLCSTCVWHYMLIYVYYSSNKDIPHVRMIIRRGSDQHRTHPAIRFWPDAQQAIILTDFQHVIVMQRIYIRAVLQSHLRITLHPSVTTLALSRLYDTSTCQYIYTRTLNSNCRNLKWRRGESPTTRPCPPCL